MATNAAIFTLQETHVSKEGTFLIDGYQIFESIRKNKKDGGSAIGIHKALEPFLIKKYNDDFELLVVEAKIQGKQVRIITGYGPQENWSESERLPLFNAIEEDILNCRLNDIPIILQMDANSKLGPHIINEDPHGQSPNGQILAGILERHRLVVVNGLKTKCKGSITRKRVTVNSVEQSIIDFVIVSDDIADLLENLLIDEDQNFALVGFIKTKTGVQKNISDHMPLITTLNKKWSWVNKIERIEMFNFKNQSCQQQFKQLTSDSDFLSSCIDENKDVNAVTNKFLKRFNGVLVKSFKKVKIKDRSNPEIRKLFERRSVLRKKDNQNSATELQIVEEELAKLCAEDNVKSIENEIKEFTCDDSGIHPGKLWRLRKKLFPKFREPPVAMKDETGKTVTSLEEIERLSILTYQDRLRNRPMISELQHLKTQKENLCELKLKAAKKNKTEPWTYNDLEKVLKSLKHSKSRDPLGLANELFDPKIAGDDLKSAILKLMNKIKTEGILPEKLKLCNISSIWKRKGARDSFENYRGIFRVTILRSILDRLIYNDEYSKIDENISDSNVGARKGRNIRDNIFVLNAVLNSAIDSNEEIDIQVYDVEKCFDALWLQGCINDLYDKGLTSDKLNLVYQGNSSAMVAIKNGTRLSNRFAIENVVMQGSVWGSLMCTATMSKIGDNAYSNSRFCYTYKRAVDIPPLGMIDDLLCIQKCSMSVTVNSAVNSFIETNKLQLGQAKCAQIHIGKYSDICPELKVHSHLMHKTKREKYLGDYITAKGNNKDNITERVNKGHAIIGEINNILTEIPLGRYRIDIGLKLRQAMFINATLFNSEAWHNVTITDINRLEKVDECLLRKILKCHSKSPIESLYLETGTLPLRFIVASRRILYLQTILKRNDDELTKKVLLAQKNAPVKGDFIKLVESDGQNLGVNIENIEKISKQGLKKLVREKARAAAFKYLSELKAKHSKVQNIIYKELACQNYLKNIVFSNEEASLLFALRTKTSKHFKANFPNMNKSCIHCPLKCWGEGEEPIKDTQEHILECKNPTKMRTSPRKVEYTHIFGNIKKQKEAVVITKQCVEEKDKF